MRGGHALTLHGPSCAAGDRPQRTYGKYRVLLALDGQRLTPAVLAAAVRECTQVTDRLDILLVNPPKAPTSLLAGLLLRLEHSGIDYRLASSEGSLDAEISRYLQRFQGITLVIVDHLPSLERAVGPGFTDLGLKGCRFISLTGPSAD